MSRAPDLPTLLDFEGQLETALGQICANSSPSITAILNREPGTSAEYGLAIRVDVGGAQESHYGRRPSGKVDYDFFDASFDIEVWANRDDDKDATQAAYNKFATFRKNARTVFLEGDTPFAAYLAYLDVRKLRPVGSVTGLIPERQQDVCTLRYTLTFGIKPGAWPAAS